MHAFQAPNIDPIERFTGLLPFPVLVSPADLGGQVAAEGHAAPRAGAEPDVAENQKGHVSEFGFVVAPIHTRLGAGKIQPAPALKRPCSLHLRLIVQRGGLWRRDGAGRAAVRASLGW